MNLIKKNAAFLILFFLLSLVHAQNEIKPEKGYTPQIGIMVDMLEDLRTRITEITKDLNQEETDFLFDEKANSIGALVMHLIANEAYYQVETIEGRQWTDKEAEFWKIGGDLNEKSREILKGKPIKYYLDLWDEERQKTLKGLKTKDDEWFASNLDEGLNIHYVWYHVLEHSANHMGQIALVKNRLPK